MKSSKEKLIEKITKSHGIGLTGGIATGKTTVARFIRDEGHPLFDADQMAREVVLPGTEGYKLIAAHFGSHVLTQNGGIDRKKLAEIIFKSPAERTKLESIVHPQIELLLQKKLEDLLDFSKPRFWFYEATLLYEVGSYKKFKEIWVTYCSEEDQLHRLVSRNRFTKEFALQIIGSQMPAKEKKDRADFSIDTSLSLDEVRRVVRHKLLVLRGGSP